MNSQVIGNTRTPILQIHTNLTQKKSRRIIGIDPGTNVLGYAFIDIVNNKMKLNNLGVIRLNKYPSHYEKLKIICQKMTFLIETYEPDEMAIEAPFFGKNPQSMLKLGRAQGVAIAMAAIKDLEVTEYAPRKIKQSITGNGNASKEQIAAMLQTLLKMEKLPKYFDATDALGVAVCHYLQSNSLLKGKGTKFKDWKSFIKDNPDRLK